MATYGSAIKVTFSGEVSASAAGVFYTVPAGRYAYIVSAQASHSGGIGSATTQYNNGGGGVTIATSSGGAAQFVSYAPKGYDGATAQDIASPPILLKAGDTISLVVTGGGSPVGSAAIIEYGNG